LTVKIKLDSILLLFCVTEPVLLGMLHWLHLGMKRPYITLCFCF